MWRRFNPNPQNLNVGDCTVRAICAVTGKSWIEIHRELCDLSERMADMPSSDRVWWELLERYGFSRQAVVCDGCSVAQFARSHPRGTYILTPYQHVVAVINGDWYDSWNSGDAIPSSYFRR